MRICGIECSDGDSVGWSWHQHHAEQQHSMRRGCGEFGCEREWRHGQLFDSLAGKHDGHRRLVGCRIKRDELCSADEQCGYALLSGTV